MPNTRISDLTAAVSVAGTDVFPSVQTAGVGPVKTSLTQITNFALANAAAGAVGAPSIAPTGDTNTGFWFPAADTIAASTAGSERLRISSTGNVGIATISPTNILSFGGNSARTIWMERHTTSNTAGNNFTLQAGGATSGATDKAGGALVLSSGTSTGTGTSFIAFNVPTAGSTGTSDNAPSERMRLNSSGLTVTTTTSSFSGILTNGAIYIRELGNSTANNAVEMHLRPNSGKSAYLTFTEDSVDDRWSLGVANGNSSLLFIAGPGSSGTERMRLTNGGNLGIGTQSPSDRFVVENTSANVVARISSGGSASYTASLGMGTSSRDWSIRADGSSTSYLLSINYTGTDAPVSNILNVTKAGNVGIGTSVFGASAASVLSIATGTAPTTSQVDTVQIYSSDLSAGNTMLSIYTEGTPVGTGTPTANRTIAVRINGTVYYLLASTIP